MKYPTFLQYIESLSNPSQLLDRLRGLLLVLDSNQEPIYSSGNFGVVFKVEIDGQIKALKCFTREQSQRDSAYRLITQELTPESPYIISHSYFTDEITVFEHSTYYKFPVLLMDWVEGEMLSSSINRALLNNNFEAISRLQQKFYNLSRWILDRSFAHGDIKPDNIMVGLDGELTLVDYDGVYLPSMQGWGQRELGTPWYQHPSRVDMAFSKAIDHYSLALINSTLELLALGDRTLVDFYLREGFLFTPSLIFRGEDEIYNYVLDSGLAVGGCFGALTSVDGRISDIDSLFGCLECRAAGLADDSLMVYEQGGLKGLVNSSNGIVVAARYDDIGVVRDGLIPVRRSRKWGYIDTLGVEVIPLIYDSATPFSGSLAAVSLNKRYGYIDRQGRSVGGFKYGYACAHRDGLGLVQWRGRYGFVNLEGRMTISAKFERASNFSEEVACACQGGLYGYIDKRGRWLVAPRFNEARSVRGGYAEVEIDGSWEVLPFSLLLLG